MECSWVESKCHPTQSKMSKCIQRPFYIKQRVKTTSAQSKIKQLRYIFHFGMTRGLINSNVLSALDLSFFFFFFYFVRNYIHPGGSP